MVQEIYEARIFMGYWTNYVVRIDLDKDNAGLFLRSLLLRK